jgi:hypothetical protein
MGKLGSQRAYNLYGVRLKSVVPLPGPELAGPGKVMVELFNGSSSFFSRVRHEAGISPGKRDWFQYARFLDGSTYLRWSGLFEFLVSADGRRIACRELNGGSQESFQTYLLGQVLSFALLKHGVEPLHATTVVIDREAVAFLGDCGYGKSSLGAAFIQAGHRLLTDDLLVLKEKGRGYVACPGPPRIKLFPEVARALLERQFKATPMNNLTPKLIVSLNCRQSYRSEVPLKAIYVLTPPSKNSCGGGISIRRLSPRRAFIVLLKNTFNIAVIEPDRLKRQFILATRLAAKVPVKSLSYPRILARLPAVREAVRLDLNNGATFSSH